MRHFSLTPTPRTCLYELALRQRPGVHRGGAVCPLGPLDRNLREHVQVLDILQRESPPVFRLLFRATSSQFRPCSPRLFAQAPALYTTDTRAMGYILTHQEEFVKPSDIKIALTLLGEGTTRVRSRFLLRDALALKSSAHRSRLRRRPYTQETGGSNSALPAGNCLLTRSVFLPSRQQQRRIMASQLNSFCATLNLNVTLPAESRVRPCTNPFIDPCIQ